MSKTCLVVLKTFRLRGFLLLLNLLNVPLFPISVTATFSTTCSMKRQKKIFSRSQVIILRIHVYKLEAALYIVRCEVLSTFKDTLSFL